MKLSQLFEAVSIKPGVKHKKRTYFQDDATGSTAELEDQGEFTLVTAVETPDDTRNRGGAKAVFDAIVKYADEKNLKLRLNVLPDEDTDQDRLISFYEKFGFKRTRGIEMVRPQKTKE